MKNQIEKLKQKKQENNEKLAYLLDLIYDVFFINASLDGSDAGSYMKKKLDKIPTVVNNLDEILSEIAKYENVMSEVEKQSGNGFADEIR